MSIGNHTVILHLGPAMRSALIKYMAKNDLDKEFAGLCLLAKSLRSEGFLSEEDYKDAISKYNRPVYQMKKARTLTSDELQEKQVLDEETRYFEAILRSEWAHHESPEWRRKVLTRADQWKDKINAAKLVLDLGVGH